MRWPFALEKREKLAILSKFERYNNDTYRMYIVIFMNEYISRHIY